MKVLANCFRGFYLLLQSPEGWLSLISIAAVSVLAFKGHVSDLAFGSVMTMIPSILIYTEHKKAIASQQVSARPPFPPDPT